MPTTGAINGTLYKLTVGGTEIDSLTGNSFSIQVDTRETTTKDDAGWTSFLASKISANYSASIIVKLDDAYALEELYDAMIARVPVTVVFTTSVTGDVQFSQSAIVTSAEVEAPMEDNVTGDFEFQGTGIITKSNVA